MTKQEVIEYLENGHSIWSVPSAKEICETISVPFNSNLIKIYHSEQPEHPLGLRMAEDCKNTPGVYSLDLSRYIATYFNVQDKVRQVMGRGTQARLYAEAIAKVVS